MTSLSKLQESWEGFAQIDPLWAICADPAKRGKQWTEEEFFETGKREIELVMQYLRSLELAPDTSSAVLDFGCGVGRLTGALSTHFDDCLGLDISPTMIELAKKFHQAAPRCMFAVNQAEDLKRFADGQFGFIYTSIVLQHMTRKLAVKYLLEFVRVLKPGGILLFQIADRDMTPMVQRIRNVIGFESRWNRFLQRKKVEAYRMEMHCTPEARIRKLLARQNVQIVDVKLTNSTEGSFNGNLQFLSEEPRAGYVSKQYCVVKGSPK
jgi:ubiquinone/menaquinone biosynthesis C-methylase UbiE